MIDKYIKNWIIKANNDLKAVEHELVLPNDEIIKDIVCFHCQQATEKFLKAYLIFYKVEFEFVHDIEYLLKLCTKVDKDFENIEVKNLSWFGVAARYPDELYIPDMKEVRFYYKLTKQIKELVTVKLGIK